MQQRADLKCGDEDGASVHTGRSSSDGTAWRPGACAVDAEAPCLDVKREGLGDLVLGGPGAACEECRHCVRHKNKADGLHDRRPNKYGAWTFGEVAGSHRICMVRDD